MALLGPPALRFLLSRGKVQMRDWSPESEFEEKQNDTAENIIYPNSQPTLEAGGAVLIDVKTVSLDRRGQPPNILSAGKLAQSLELALASGHVPYDILYVAVAWRATASELIAEEVAVKSLFRIAADLYINWVAAQQIQFHPLQVDQDFDGTREEWAKKFLSTFVRSLDSRITRQMKLRDRYQRLVDSSHQVAAEEGPQ
jgi:type II restriction enzyme